MDIILVVAIILMAGFAFLAQYAKIPSILSSFYVIFMFMSQYGMYLNIYQGYMSSYIFIFYALIGYALTEVSFFTNLAQVKLFIGSALIASTTFSYLILVMVLGIIGKYVHDKYKTQSDNVILAIFISLGVTSFL